MPLECQKEEFRELAQALINEAMLRWALERSGGNVESLASRMGVSEAKLEAWISGEERPTFNQARKAASILQIPFGYLYMPEPPNDQIPIAEFRRLPGIGRKIDRDVYDLLSDIDFKRDWYRDYRLEEGFEPLEFIGRFELASPTLIVANDIRRELSKVSSSLFLTRKNSDRFLDEFIKAAEKLGIWVMRSGVVANNTHRPISVDSLRGFAVSDKIAPLIFLNGKDSKNAQVFTFAHELAHLWIGESSIEFGDLSHIVSKGNEAVEKKCNSIAAELLVPRDEFAKRWNRNSDLNEQASTLAEAFSVSRVVIARRALEQGYISESEYRAFYATESMRWQENAASSGGGSYYNNIPARNGKTFTNSVTREAAIGRLLYRDAGQLLGVQPSKVREIFERSRS